MTPTEQPTAAVTGAGSGLGRELALGLAAKNYRVYGTICGHGVRIRGLAVT
jgi:NAD(P)-dependent dehydrogenase (short-subunit alcohol dehydrogenase family)